MTDSSTALLSNSPFVGNGSVGDGGAGGEADAGGIYSAGRLWTVNCTFSGNQAIGGSGGKGGTNTFYAGKSGGAGGAGGNAIGGAVNAALVAMTNWTTTYSGNVANAGAGGAGGDSVNGPGGPGGDSGLSFGGGVSTLVAEFKSCTIVSNPAVGRSVGQGGSGLPPGNSGSAGNQLAGGVNGYTIVCLCAIGNTILSDNFAGTGYTNYLIAFSDIGNNFIGSLDWVQCPFNAGNNFLGTIGSPIHAQLRPLAQNGGGLPTHAPATNSLVVDAGYSFGIATDERAAPRPFDFNWIPNGLPGSDGSDIGAVELGQADLGLGSSGGGVVISWPASYGDFTLQSSTNLSQMPAWTSVTDAPVVVGNSLVITNPVAGKLKFYRLMSR